MRGIIGAGVNRMNAYTVRQATEGLARFMDSRGDETKKRGVAIAYDSRHKSPEFAMEAARTLGAHGIPAFVFESLRPTPELSFAVRHLNAFAGIMITARPSTTITSMMTTVSTPATCASSSASSVCVLTTMSSSPAT